MKPMVFILIRGVLTVPAISVIPAEHELGLRCYNCTNKFTPVKCVSAVSGWEIPFRVHSYWFGQCDYLYNRLEGDLSDTFLRSAFLSSNIQSALQQEGHRDAGNSSRTLRRCKSCYK